MKTCRTCLQNKELEEFYKHPKMLDKHLNICKTCTCKRVSEYSKTSKGKLIDKRRNQTETRKRWLVEFQRKERVKFKIKNRARAIFNRATSLGKIQRKDHCELCNIKGRIEAHHPDYNKPLDVIYLCVKCHKHTHLI